MSDFLDRIAPGARRRAADARARLEFLRRECAVLPPTPKLRLSSRGFDLIAEFKRRAPSVGDLGRGTAPVECARNYASAGAAALSVLTEPDHFSGSLGHLSRAAHAIDVPVMRKDFLLDAAQLFEARAAGASGALLIARLLDEDRIDEMIEAAVETGLFLLIEAFDERELTLAVEAAERCRRREVRALVGVNARDLATLGVDFERLRRLAPLIPPDVPAVAESGLATPEDAASVARLGYRLALVGSALMRADDPGALVTAMVDAGRAAHSKRRAYRETVCESA